MKKVKYILLFVCVTLCYALGFSQTDSSFTGVNQSATDLLSLAAQLLQGINPLAAKILLILSPIIMFFVRKYEKKSIGAKVHAITTDVMSLKDLPIAHLNAIQGLAQKLGFKPKDDTKK